jgi:serine/threonine-protein kinase RsbW
VSEIFGADLSFLKLCARRTLAAMDNRRILIVETDGEMRSTLKREFEGLGHEVFLAADRKFALTKLNLDDFDVIVSDLTDETQCEWGEATDSQRERVIAAAGNGTPTTYDAVNAFKFDAVNPNRRRFEQSELSELLSRALLVKNKCLESRSRGLSTREMVDFELPSDISLMHSVLNYLIERVARIGLINPDHSNLFVALDEAFVNAVKHGNRHDMTKHIRIIADLSPKEARFMVEDEGEGFNVQEIPDPCDPENLFKASGRGVMLIYNIMDEVEYNARGNRLVMVKRPEGSIKRELVEASTPEDKSICN